MRLKEKKYFNFLLILTSLVGYLEWGLDSKLLLFQIEGEIISKIFKDPVSVIHPFTTLPLIGQLMLFITLFQKKPNKILTFIGIGGLGILLGLIFVIGILNFNIKMLLSAVPFLLIAFMSVRDQRKKQNKELINHG